MGFGFDRKGPVGKSIKMGGDSYGERRETIQYYSGLGFGPAPFLIFDAVLCTPFTPSPSLPKMDMPNSATRFPIMHTKSSVLPFPLPFPTAEYAVDRFVPVFVPFTPVHPPLASLVDAMRPPISKAFAMYILSALGAAPYCIF
jgi:hypothetical protein